MKIPCPAQRHYTTIRSRLRLACAALAPALVLAVISAVIEAATAAGAFIVLVAVLLVSIFRGRRYLSVMRQSDQWLPVSAQLHVKGSFVGVKATMNVFERSWTVRCPFLNIPKRSELVDGLSNHQVSHRRTVVVSASGSRGWILTASGRR